MKNESVAVLKLDKCNYHSTIEQALELIGFDYRDICKNIILKPNLVSASLPEEGKTTDPLVLGAIAKLLKSHNKKISVGESVSSNVDGNLLLRTTGVEEICKKNSLNFIQFERLEQKLVELPDSLGNVIIPNLKYKEIVNVPKLKMHLHHGIGMSCCIKNMFGCVPGIQKSLIHTKTKDGEKFFRTLIEIYNLLKPAINIVDAVNVYDKEPKYGDKVSLGLIIAGRDGFAVDSVICEMLGLDKKKIGILRFAEKEGIGYSDLDEIDVVGESIEGLKRTFHFSGKKRRAYFESAAYLKNMYVQHFIKPQIINKKYISSELISSCPINAISNKGIDQKICLRCEHCIYIKNCPVVLNDRFGFIKRGITSKLRL